MLKHWRMLLPILIHASPTLIHALPILIHGLGFRLSAPYLNTCIAYLNTSSWLSAPNLNTCIAFLNTLSRFSAPYLNSLNRLGSQSESSITSPESSESSITSNPRALGAWRSFLGSSRLAIAYLNTWGTSTPLLWSAHTLSTNGSFGWWSI